MSFMLYASDHNGELPVYVALDNNGNRTITWHKVLCEGGYAGCTDQEARGWYGVGGAAAGHKTIFWCPSDQRNPTRDNTHPQGVSYPINAIITNDSGNPGYTWLTLNGVQHPTQTMLVIDGWRYNYEWGVIWIQPYTQMDRIDYRHRGAAQYLCIDGHVTELRPEDATSDPKDPFWGKPN